MLKAGFLTQLRLDYAGRPIAFVPLPDGKLGVAVLGEAGYTPIPPSAFRATPPENFLEANAEADRLNEEIGLHPLAMDCIIADTMMRSERNREEAAGITRVKLSWREIRTLAAVLSDYDDIDVARDAEQVTGSDDILVEGEAEDLQTRFVDMLKEAGQ